MVLSGLTAYPRGFTFYVATMSRTGAESVAPARGSAEPWGPDFLRLGFRFADGSKTTNLGGWQQRDSGDGVPMLRTRGGGGNFAKWTYRCQCSPLPPPGPMGVVCEWPAHGIGQIEHEIDGTAIREAGLAAAPVWPDDVDLPETPEGAL